MNAMTINRRGAGHPLPELIRDQLHDANNVRFLRNMPVFQPINDRQDVFDALLDRLEVAEAAAARTPLRKA